MIKYLQELVRSFKRTKLKPVKGAVEAKFEMDICRNGVHEKRAIGYYHQDWIKCLKGRARIAIEDIRRG